VPLRDPRDCVFLLRREPRLAGLTLTTNQVNQAAADADVLERDGRILECNLGKVGDALLALEEKRRLERFRQIMRRFPYAGPDRRNAKRFRKPLTPRRGEPVPAFGPPRAGTGESSN
jgi:hypothetical protein